MALTDKLTNIANAIREKTGSSEKITLDDMVDEINKLGTTINNTTTLYNKSSVYELNVNGKICPSNESIIINVGDIINITVAGDAGFSDVRLHDTNVVIPFVNQHIDKLNYTGLVPLVPEVNKNIAFIAPKYAVDITFSIVD